MNLSELMVKIAIVISIIGFYPINSQMSTQKYKHIKTEHYEIVFPEEVSKSAVEAAHIAEKNYEKNKRDLKPEKNFKTPIILNNLTLTSNGYFTLAPAYSMLYLLPPQQDTYRQYYDRWLEELVIHEMRHKVQFNYLNRGFNRFLYYLFGDAGWLYGIGVSVPVWFIEGDAVYHESDFEEHGRGRLPYFTSLTRAIVFSENIPTYDQMYLGSNLHVYPNKYEMGYLLTAYMRKKYGSEIFSEILKYSSTWNFLFGPYAFQAAVYNKTNRSIHSVYNSMITELRKEWNKKYNPDDYITYDSLTKSPGEIYTVYASPFKNSRGLFAYKFGRFQTGAIVKISPKKSESTIVIPGSLSGNLTFNDSLIVWSEEIPDVRWDDSTSVVRVYDLKKNSESTLRLNGRIVAPSISPDGIRIAAMQFNKRGESSLVLINRATGKIEESIPEPFKKTWQTPRWGRSSESLAVVESSEEGKSVVILNTRTKKLERPMKPVSAQISDPFVYKNYVLFHSDLSGIDNIFALDTNNGKLYQVTNSFLGCLQPSVATDTEEIYFSNISAKGRYLSKIPFEPEKWFAVKENKNPVYMLFQAALNEPLKKVGFEKPDESKYKIEDYPDFLRAFNFHTRYIDPTMYPFNSSISAIIQSSNVLQTHFMSLFYTYNVNEDLHKVRGEWMFRGWYPVFRLGAFYGYNNGALVNFNSPTIIPYQWNETGGYLQSSVPLKFIDGSFFQWVEPGLQVVYSQVEDYIVDSIPETYNNHSGFRNLYFLTYNIGIQGNQWLFNRPYFMMGLKFYYGPDYLVFNESREVYEGLAVIEMPGFYYNHKISVKGSASYREDSTDHLFTSTVIYPRGYYTSSFNEFYLVSADYTAPLFYPDSDILHVLFLRQISLNLFYEHIWYVPENAEFSEYIGADLLFHVNLFELKSEILFGARFIYYPDSDSSILQPLLNISITGTF